MGNFHFTAAKVIRIEHLRYNEISEQLFQAGQAGEQSVKIREDNAGIGKPAGAA